MVLGQFGELKFQFPLDVVFELIFIGFAVPLGCILGGLDEFVGTKNCIFSWFALRRRVLF